MVLPQPVGLAPLDPAVKAKRKRQNRIIVALIVMIAVPTLTISGAWGYTTAAVSAWAAAPTFAYNTLTRIGLDPGDYVLWTFGTRADCSVEHQGSAVPVDYPPSQGILRESGFYHSASFTAHIKGDYYVLCEADIAQGYGMVSTPSPMGQATLILIIAVLVGVASFITGVVLLIVGLVNNSADKKGTAPTAVRVQWVPVQPWHAGPGQGHPRQDGWPGNQPFPNPPPGPPAQVPSNPMSAMPTTPTTQQWPPRG